MEQSLWILEDGTTRIVKPNRRERKFIMKNIVNVLKVVLRKI